MPDKRKNQASEEKTPWPAGEYVVTVDKLRLEEFAENDQAKKEPVQTYIYEKGEEVELDEAEANRHGEGGAIAKPDTLEAKVAQGEVHSTHAPPPGLTDEDIDKRIEALEQVREDRKTTKDESAEEPSKDEPEGPNEAPAEKQKRGANKGADAQPK